MLEVNVKQLTFEDFQNRQLSEPNVFDCNPLKVTVVLCQKLADKNLYPQTRAKSPLQQLMQSFYDNYLFGKIIFRENETNHFGALNSEAPDNRTLLIPNNLSKLLKEQPQQTLTELVSAAAALIKTKPHNDYLRQRLKELNQLVLPN